MGFPFPSLPFPFLLSLTARRVERRGVVVGDKVARFSVFQPVRVVAIMSSHGIVGVDSVESFVLTSGFASKNAAESAEEIKSCMYFFIYFFLDTLFKVNEQFVSYPRIPRRKSR